MNDEDRKIMFYDFDEADEEDGIVDNIVYSEEDNDPLAGEKMRIDIMIGVIIAAVPFTVLGIVWNGRSLLFLSGLALGVIISEGLVNHMYRTLLAACEYEQKQAETYMVKNSIKRLAIMGVTLILAGIISEPILVFGILIGFSCLKFSAYMQPLTNKYVSKKFIRKGR